MKLENMDPKERILKAAADVFGKHGYRDATVRQICKHAGVSVALVNYHYRNKEGLYLAVLEDLLSKGFEKFPPDLGITPESKPEERLHAFIRSFLFRLLSKSSWAGYQGQGRLLAKEIADPSPIMDKIVEKYIRPNKEILVSILKDLLGSEASIETIQHCALSIVGQCLHHAYARPIIERLQIEQGSTDQDIERLADHITKFSLGGIEKITA
jgi:AcrR family transcriptional regulator